MKKIPQADLLDALKNLLVSRKASSQEAICESLEKLGYDINQTKVSRLLRKVGAIKVVNAQGDVVYSLPREPAPPSMHTKIRDLIVDVVCNEALVIIFTSPGSASMVARVLDYKMATTSILGTMAGDDTIFVAPRSIKDVRKLADEIRQLFQE